MLLLKLLKLSIRKQLELMINVAQQMLVMALLILNTIYIIMPSAQYVADYFAFIVLLINTNCCQI